MLQLQALGEEHDNTERSAGQRLLVLKVSVCGHEHVEVGRSGTAQELTIQHACPPLCGYRGYIMTRQFSRKLAGYVLVQENAPSLRCRVTHAALGSCASSA